MKTVQTDKAAAAIGPYAQGIVVGGMLYTSGQIPLMTDGTMVDGGIEAQTGQVMANLEAVIAEAGASLSDIVKTTIFCTDLGDFAAINEVYGKALGGHKPARSTIQVAGLPKGARIEIEAVVRLPGA